MYHYSGTVINQVDITTRLLNRRCFERGIKNVKLPAYMLIFDADNLKTINDSLGHNEGDKCLNTVAAKIMSVYGKYGL